MDNMQYYKCLLTYFLTVHSTYRKHRKTSEFFGKKPMYGWNAEVIRWERL